jgi:hypothetical protein
MKVLSKFVWSGLLSLLALTLLVYAFSPRLSLRLNNPSAFNIPILGQPISNIDSIVAMILAAIFALVAVRVLLDAGRIQDTRNFSGVVLTLVLLGCALGGGLGGITTYLFMRHQDEARIAQLELWLRTCEDAYVTTVEELDELKSPDGRIPGFLLKP